MAYTYDPNDVKQRELAPGVMLRTMWGEKVMLSVVEIDANSEVPMHEHPHEQAGMVLEGEFDFTIGGVTTQGQAGRHLHHSRRGRARSGGYGSAIEGPWIYSALRERTTWTDLSHQCYRDKSKRGVPSNAPS